MTGIISSESAKDAVPGCTVVSHGASGKRGAGDTYPQLMGGCGND